MYIKRSVANAIISGFFCEEYKCIEIVHLDCTARQIDYYIVEIQLIIFVVF